MKIPIVQAAKQWGKMLGSGGGSGMDKVSTLTGTQKKLQKTGAKMAKHGLQDITQNPLYQHVANYLQQFFGNPEETYGAFEGPAMRQFQQEIVPEISERFAGLNAMGSSGFQQSLGSAGAGLAERLAMLRQGVNQNMMGQAMNVAQQPISNAMGIYGTTLGTPSFGYQQQAPSMMQNLMGGLAQAAPYAAMAML